MFWLAFICWLFPQEPMQEITPGLRDEVLAAFARSVPEAKQLVERHRITPYFFGIFLTTEKPDKAQQWFRAMAEVDPKNHLEYSSGLAWAYWCSSELVKAHHELVFLLASDARPNLQARAHYLLGVIYSRMWNPSAAEEHLEQAIALYNAERLQGGVVNCLIILIDIAYVKNDLAKVEQLLAEAERLNELRANPIEGHGPIHYYKACVHFKRREYQAAILHYQQAISLIQKTEESLRQLARTNLALCAVLVGDMRMAFENARAVNQYVEDANRVEKSDRNQFIYYYNSLAWILINQCKGTEINTLEQELVTWSKNHPNNPELLAMLKFVKSVNCP